jgi:hypothetical protein
MTPPMRMTLVMTLAMTRMAKRWQAAQVSQRGAP